MALNQDPDPTQEQSVEWQRDLIERLATSSLAEQKRARRWGIFFKFLTFAYLVGILILYTPSIDMDSGEHKRHTALVELKGVISADHEANADSIVTGLRDAFKNKNTAGVILRINSPGGSPVQAGYINDEIARLRIKYPDIPLYAVIADVCASGGYYVAAATDKIYADKASIVGSIGVRMDGFGFVGTMEKLGVERRLMTAGENKGFLDPFQPAKASDIAHVNELLADIHSQFINVVRNGRGDRLNETPELFSGFVWTGEQSIDLGLVDELGSASYVARDVIGAETIVDYTPQEDLFQKFSKRFGTALGRGVGQVLTGEGMTLR